MPQFTADDKLNLDAVVSDYKNGSLHLPPAGKAVIYYAGVRKTPDPVDMIDFSVVEMVDQCIAAGARGRIWIEQVRSLNHS